MNCIIFFLLTAAAVALVLAADLLLHRRAMKKRAQCRQRCRQLDREHFAGIADRQTQEERTAPRP